MSTPLGALQQGKYKLRCTVTNPAGKPFELDWRLMERFPCGMEFYCFDLYHWGKVIPALHDGHPRIRLSIHEGMMPEVLHAILPYLERV
jgi:hypothetical protein